MRTARYGEIKSGTLSNQIRSIWYTKEREPDPIEYYQLCDYEWQTMDQVSRNLDTKAIFGMLMSNLTKREQLVMKTRFIDGMTQEEVGCLLGVSKNRVFQIEFKAMRKCKLRLLLKNHFKAAMHKYHKQMMEAS